MCNKRLTLLISLIATAAAPHTASATGFKCVGPDGAIEYRELAVDGKQCTPLRTTPKSILPEKSADADAADDASAQIAAAPRSEQEQRTRNCERARANADVLKGDRDVLSTGTDGSKRVLGADERAEALAQTEKDIAYWCGE